MPPVAQDVSETPPLHELIRQALKDSGLSKRQAAKRLAAEKEITFESALSELNRRTSPRGGGLTDASARALEKVLGKAPGYFPARGDGDALYDVLAGIQERIASLARQVEAQTALLAELLRLAQDDPGQSPVVGG